MSEQTKSVGWVAALLFLAVGYAGWGFLAADYFQHAQVGGPPEANFFANSITQLPNLPAVLTHAFQNRLWLIILIVALEVGVSVLWVVLRKLERELWEK